MEVIEKKLELIQWISTLEDEKLIIELMGYKNHHEADLWDELSEYEKNEIELGLKDIEEGRVVPHSEVMKIFDKWR
jgi:hypothetical protein